MLKKLILILYGTRKNFFLTFHGVNYKFFSLKLFWKNILENIYLTIALSVNIILGPVFYKTHDSIRSHIFYRKNCILKHLLMIIDFFRKFLPKTHNLSVLDLDIFEVWTPKHNTSVIKKFKYKKILALRYWKKVEWNVSTGCKMQIRSPCTSPSSVCVCWIYIQMRFLKIHGFYSVSK